MSAIPFTDRELKRAWRELSAIALPAAGVSRKNAHRLLLFYAVECGLKAVLLKRQNRSVFGHEDIEKTGHNLRQVIKELKVGKEFTLPENLQIGPVNLNGAVHHRNGDIRILHQVWRYGGQCTAPNDQDCEKQLEQVWKWIDGELR